MNITNLKAMCELMLGNLPSMNDFRLELNHYKGRKRYGMKIVHKSEERHYWTSSDFHPERDPEDLFFNLLEYAVERELAIIN